MLIILIISFLKIGSGAKINQINACLIIIVLFVMLLLQVRESPFITYELNSLDFLATLIIIVSLFGGIFASLSENSALTQIIMIIIFLLNIYFLYLFFSDYIIMLLILRKANKGAGEKDNIIDVLTKKYLLNS